MSQIVTSQQRTPNTNDYPTPLNETPYENFLRTPLIISSTRYIASQARFPIRVHVTSSWHYPTFRRVLRHFDQDL